MAGEDTATLARSITRTSSKQTYYTARLMVDKELVSDFFRAYAYFRWADDIIDVSLPSKSERISFVNRQRGLIDRLYNNEYPDDLCLEEEIVADLIHTDRDKNSGLRSFISNMFAIIEFDAHRKGRVISNSELTLYSESLAQAVTDGLQYFIGNDHSYPATENRYLAANAAHIVHLLRDMVSDIQDGFINIPHEYLDEHGIDPEDMDSPAFRAWVRKRVKQARVQFLEGKSYFDSLEVLRCRVMGYWYCARFEGILDKIECDNYRLRVFYNKHFVGLKMLWLGVSLTFQHIFGSVFGARDKKASKLSQYINKNID